MWGRVVWSAGDISVSRLVGLWEQVVVFKTGGGVGTRTPLCPGRAAVSSLCPRQIGSIVFLKVNEAFQPIQIIELLACCLQNNTVVDWR